MISFLLKVDAQSQAIALISVLSRVIFLETLSRLVEDMV